MKHLQEVQKALSLRLWVVSTLHIQERSEELELDTTAGVTWEQVKEGGTLGVGKFGHVTLMNVTEPCSDPAARAPRFVLNFPVSLGCEGSVLSSLLAP